jgi:CHAT domain-containing protein
LRLAGAGTVVGSYWAVDDTSSAALMTAFYRELWDRPGEVAPERALRAAQLEMIRGGAAEAGDRSLAHPKNWAGFFVMGSPG